MNNISKIRFQDLYEMGSGISSTKDQAGHGAPFVSFSTVFNNYFLPEELPDKMDTSATEQEACSVKAGDIFLTRTSETIDELAMSCVATKDYPHATFSGFLKRLRPKATGIVYDKYLAFYLRGNLFRRTITNNAFMTLRASFNEDIFSYLHLYLPPFEQQILMGDLLYKMELKKQLNKRICTELESMAKTLYDYWFVQFDFPDANGKPYRASGGEMVWNEQIKREIPKGWNVATLGDACTFRNGINYDKSQVGDKTYRIINVRNITTSSLLLDENELDHICLPQKQADAYQVTPQDIIIARSGTPGATRIINPSDKTIFCGFIICCRPKNRLQKLYFAYLLKQLEGTSATKTGGSILQNVSQDTLKSIRVAIPPDDVLEQYSSIINVWLQRIQSVLRENHELSDLRDWLLPMLINGQATVEPMDTSPLLRALTPEKPARDPRFDRWLQTQGLAARGNVDEQTLHDIFDAMDDDDKQ